MRLIKKENNLANTQALEDKLDRLIYQLYDLTQEEIKIIENTVK